MNTISKFLLPATIGSLMIGCLGSQGFANLSNQQKQTGCPVIYQINGSCDLNSIFGQNSSCDLNSIFGQNGSCSSKPIFGQEGSSDLNSILNQLLGNLNWGQSGSQNSGSGGNQSGSQKPSSGSNQSGSQKPNTGGNQSGSQKPDNGSNQGGNQNKPENIDNSLSSTAQSYIAQIVTLVNAERAKNGLSAVTYDSTLHSAAQVRAEEIVSSFSHTRPNGTYYSSVLKEFDVSYRRSGENIAWGQKTPEEVMTAWMNSSGHRANILNASYNKIGVGCNISPSGTIYWSQLFTD